MVDNLLSSKGGLIIYLHEHFKHKCRLKLDNYATLEGQVIEVSHGKILNKPLYIGNIYRPPKENLLMNLLTFSTNLKKVIKK